MKELLPVVSDDLTWTEEKVREPADREISVGFMGAWFNLDVDGQHFLEVRDLLARYMKAGERTTKPHRAARVASGTDYPAMRKWADETSYRTPRGDPGYHASLDGKGGYYHSKFLLRDWASHLEESDGLGSDRAE